MVELFSGLWPRTFARLITGLRREGIDRPLRGRPWGLCFEDRVLLVATYWRTNLTMRQLAAV
ncbi:transposase family protein, partial [Nocardia sp. NPDC059246]|uniref:transposase family protein n=1 Tax=Nocardia sp. NPDC059246 TaxID=3346789 RepID=UPI0036757666